MAGTLALRCYALISSKLRLLRHANAARGWDCRGCVCAGVHWHCQGTQPHSTRITTRAFHSNLNCISCIIVSWSRVGGMSLNFALLDAVSLVCSSAVSPAACYSIAPSLSLAENELFWQFAHGACVARLVPLSSLLILPSLCRHWPDARRLRCALPSRFRGRRHSSTWQDTDTTATNLGQIRCRGICAF